MTAAAPPTVPALLEGIRRGDTGFLARAITLMESTREEDRERAASLMEGCLPMQRKSMRVGITGVPGVGKSTFIEALGRLVTGEGKRVAVLAIDPSSSISKGSIMGDKTRMPDLAKNPLAFVRPSPAGENPGGVARHTREAMLLCEAAGFELILIETLGVGQGETAVHGMVDFFLLLQLAGAGDELQGIKRGIMEMADALVINKADGANLPPAEEARQVYQRALQLYPPKENGWRPPALCCSALQQSGMEELWDLIKSYMKTYWDNGYLQARRKEQNSEWFRQSIEAHLTRDFYASKAVRDALDPLMKQVAEERISPFRAAHLLLQAYRQELK